MEYVSKKARRSNQELSSLGKRIASMLDEAYGENTDIKAGGMPNDFRKFVVIHLVTMFTTLAKGLGVLPEQVFKQYGPQMFLSPADATRTADGKLQVMSDRAKGLFTLRKAQESFHHTTLKKRDSTKAEIRNFLKGVRKSKPRGEKESFIPLGDVSPVLVEMIRNALG